MNAFSFPVFAQTNHQDTRAIQCQSTDLRRRNLFLQLLLFKNCFCFLSRKLEALIESNAPDPGQNTESEKTCTLGESMLPIGSFE